MTAYTPKVAKKKAKELKRLAKRLSECAESQYMRDMATAIYRDAAAYASNSARYEQAKKDLTEALAVWEKT